MVKFNFILLFFVFFLSCKKNQVDAPLTGIPTIEIKTILSGYEIIWGMDFLPNGDLIFGEKKGTIYKKSKETITELKGFPKVLAGGQGGLLDIRVHPDFATNGWIYACYAAENPGAGGQLKLIRFKINIDQIQNIENIFNTNGPNTWLGHYGARIIFDKNKMLYLSTGEGGTTSYGGPNSGNKNSSNTGSSWGKIHRMFSDGSIPTDNPLLPGNAIPGSIYSYGHRNPQGMAIHPVTQELWENEHGPKGGDEINIISKGANYGWPTYSVGVNYDNSTISSSHTAPGITAPLYTWTPSIGVCGMVFINHKSFKSWNGNLLVSGLASQKLYRCTVEGNKIIGEEVLLSNTGRIRNVIQGPDGSIYVSAEGPGKILQIIPN